MSFPTSPPVWQDSSQAAVDVQTNNVWTQTAVDSICEDLYFILGADGKTPTAGIPVRLADTTLGVAATNITFSSIPATFKHLMILMQSRGDGAVGLEYVRAQLNGDTGANYDFSRGGQQANAADGAGINADTAISIGIQVGASATRAATASALSLWIPNYANTTFEKSTFSLGGSNDSTLARTAVQANSGSWRNTAAVNAVKLFPNTSTNFVAGTRATLYGWN